MTTETTMVPTAVAGQVARQEFGAAQIERLAETATTASAATAKALVEARFVMAIRRPRDWDDVRTKLLRSIERPGFAGKAGQKSKPGEAWFVKPIGDGVEGFTIRFAEECVRSLGNLDVRPMVVYEDDVKRVVDVAVLDLETNNGFTQSVVIPKTVERSSLRKGELAISVRTNSEGRAVYTRVATEDELFAAQNSAISKIMRNEVMRLVPGDIQADCRARILEIRFGDAASNPDGVRKEITDAFARLNVPPSQIKEYLEHDLALASPAELAHLREVYKGIRDGTTTWLAVMAEAKRDEAGPTVQPKPGLDGMADKLEQRQPPAVAPPEPQREQGDDDADPTPSTAAPKTLCLHVDAVERAKTTPGNRAVVCTMPGCGAEIPGEGPVEPFRRRERAPLQG